MSTQFNIDHLSIAIRTSTDDVRKVLVDLSFTIEQGEWLAVVGPNGSGKSSLAKALAGFMTLSRGTISNHSSSHGLSKTQLIMQNPEAQIVGQTVYEDICFGLENYALPAHDMPARVYQTMSDITLHVHPDTDVNWLSGGQKQLLCIADHVVLDPETLIFDESTSMLDPKTRELVLRTVQRLNQEGKTIIWITQWMEEIHYAHRVLALDAGQCTYFGPPTGFFYPTEAHKTSPCEDLGFVSPYAVQVARELSQMGIIFQTPPLTPEELSKGVRAACPSPLGI